MTEANSTPKMTITQQLALEIQIGEGEHARLIYMPVADAAESLALQKRINKTPGKLLLGEDTQAPMTIHCGRVLFMNTVLLPPQTQQVVSPPVRLAKLNQ